MENLGSVAGHTVVEGDVQIELAEVVDDVLYTGFFLQLAQSLSFFFDQLFAEVWSR